MNQPPLNPDALRRAADEFDADMSHCCCGMNGVMQCDYCMGEAENIVTAYLTVALPEVTSVPGVYDLGAREPAGVDHVVECDEHGHPYIRHWAEDEDYTWSKTTDGTRWKGYKDGKEYRSWADLVRRYGPLTEYRPDVSS